MYVRTYVYGYMNVRTTKVQFTCHIRMHTTYVAMYLVGLSDHRDGIHYRDSLTLLMNKIVGC